MKAYDSIPCDFILQCLTAVGVPAIFVDWVRECISSASFSIALNGNLVGDFKGGKGLRQGDPLSSYLLILGWRSSLELCIAKSRRLSTLNSIQMTF